MTFLKKSGEDLICVGLAGAGTMGKCMLEGLIQAGYPVFVYDPYEPAREYAGAKGAKIVQGAEELAEKTQVILLSLPKPAHVLQTVETLKKKLMKDQVIIDTSTVDPETSKKAAQIAEGCQAHYIDAPILGRPSAAGKWLMPAGGEEQWISYVQPVLSCFARQAVYVGGHGAGNVFKLLNQLMFSVINGISAEVMTLAEVLGIDQQIFYQVVSQSGAATVSGLFCETAKRIADGQYEDPTFTVELLCKDAGLGIQMAKEAGVTPLIASFVQVLNENARGKGFSKKDTSVLAEVFEQFYSKIDK